MFISLKHPFFEYSSSLLLVLLILWLYLNLIFDIENSLYLFYFCITMILRYYYYFGIFDFNTFIYFSERNGIISKYYYSKITQNKATRFFRKPLYQSSPNAVPLIPFVNGKFKPDDNFFLEL